jgi:hypothetical protein
MKTEYVVTLARSFQIRDQSDNFNLAVIKAINLATEHNKQFSVRAINYYDNDKKTTKLYYTTPKDLNKKLKVIEDKYDAIANSLKQASGRVS